MTTPPMGVFQQPSREMMESCQPGFQEGEGSDSLVDVDRREDFLYAGPWNCFDLSFLFGGGLWTES
jgi:hypothetical protein